MLGTISVRGQTSFALKLAQVVAHLAELSIAIHIGILVRESELNNRPSSLCEILQLTTLESSQIHPFDTVVMIHRMKSSADHQSQGVMVKSAKNLVPQSVLIV